MHGMVVAELNKKGQNQSNKGFSSKYHQILHFPFFNSKALLH